MKDEPVYYVFSSSTRDPTQVEREAGSCLRGIANARYLQQFFDPLYEAAGIAISRFDDEIICENAKLLALRDAIAAARVALRNSPAEWPIDVGFRHTEQMSKVAVTDIVSRARLETFLSDVDLMVETVMHKGGCIHFCEGG